MTKPSRTRMITFKHTLGLLVSKLGNSAAPRNQLARSRTMLRARLAVLALIQLCLLAPMDLGHAAGRVFFDGFEDGTTNLWVQDDFHNKCTVVTSAIDGGSPHSGTEMARCNWNGTVAWNDPSAYETLRLNSWSYSTEFLIRFWVRYDSDVDHAFGAKAFRLYNSLNSWYWAAQMEQTGGPVISIFELIDGSTYSSVHYGAALVGDNQWHKVEIYFKQGTGGTAIFRFWVDGNLQDQITGFSSNPSNKWFPMYIMSNWSNNGPQWAHDANNHVYWDDIEIYSDTLTGASGSMSDASITVSGSSSASQSIPTAPTNLVVQ